jgi:hypothetical protein
MNIDTDTQYSFTRPVVDHMFRRYDRVLKIDDELGKKKDVVGVCARGLRRGLLLTANRGLVCGDGQVHREVTTALKMAL